MIGVRQLAQPWARASTLYSQPGSILVKLRLGEAPVRVESRFGIAEVDRVLSHYADDVRVERVHTPANGRWDDLEHALGLARTFQVSTDRDCCLASEIDGGGEDGVRRPLRGGWRVRGRHVGNCLTGASGYSR